MIRQVISNSPWITADQVYAAPFISNNSNGVGQIRFNVINQEIEVWDGHGWTVISGGTVKVDVTYQTQEILSWARLKMCEEQTLLAEAKQHPAVADALNAYNEAANKLKVVVALTKEEQK
jgi:hypothetical protein